MTSPTQRPSVESLLVDLAEEQLEVRQMVSRIGAAEWRRPTTPGWTVRDQIAHLAFFDDAAATSIGEPDRFAAGKRAALADTAAYERDLLLTLPADGPTVLERWTAASHRFRSAAAAADPAVRLQWFGPDMGLLSMVTARLMETWAHGQDVADALGVRRVPTRRLEHVARLAVQARAEGYRVRGLPTPSTSVRVDLCGPGGRRWTFGDPNADQCVSGTAEDFCLVLARRRHVDDTALAWNGEAAREWLRIGQVYAGPPGEGPRRRTDEQGND